MCDELRYRINPFSWVAEMEKGKKWLSFFFFRIPLFKEMLSGRPGDYSNYFHNRQHRPKDDQTAPLFN